MSQPEETIEYQQYAYSTEFLPTQQGFRISIKVRTNDPNLIITEPFRIWEAQLLLAKEKNMTLAPHMEPEDPDELRKKLEEMKRLSAEKGNTKTQKGSKDT